MDEFVIKTNKCNRERQKPTPSRGTNTIRIGAENFDKLFCLSCRTDISILQLANSCIDFAFKHLVIEHGECNECVIDLSEFER